jgi:drug/metabolite transporter (DMT)-like permease
MKRIDLSNRKWQIIILLFLAFIWGSSFILMKKGLEAFSNTQVAAIRIFVSFTVLLPVIRKNYQKITWQNLKSLLIAGVIGIGIPAVLFATAQTRINSSLAGMLNSLTPLFALLTGLLFYKTKLCYAKTLGILIGLAGAVGLVYRSEAGLLNSLNPYALLVVIATICYGITVNEIKFKLGNLNGLTITSLGLLFIGPVAGIYLVFSDFSATLSTKGWPINLVCIITLAVFGTAIALIVFNTLLKYTSPLFATSVTYIIPIFALLWGIFDGESIKITHIFSILLILAGVFIINQRDSQEQTQAVN